MSSINKQISIEQAALEGVSIDFEQMNNGEKRFRLNRGRRRGVNVSRN